MPSGSLKRQTVLSPISIISANADSTTEVQMIRNKKTLSSESMLLLTWVFSPLHVFIY